MAVTGTSCARQQSRRNRVRHHCQRCQRPRVPWLPPPSLARWNCLRACRASSIEIPVQAATNSANYVRSALGTSQTRFRCRECALTPIAYQQRLRCTLAPVAASPETLAGVARQAPKNAAMERLHFDRIIGAWLRAKLMPGQLEVQPTRLLNSLADDRRKGTRSTAARDGGNREIPSARGEALQRIGRRSRIGDGRRLRQCA
jgi:hypothetical protein